MIVPENVQAKTILILHKVPDIIYENFNRLKIILHIYIFIYISYLPTPPLGQDMTQGQFLSGV